MSSKSVRGKGPKVSSSKGETGKGERGGKLVGIGVKDCFFRGNAEKLRRKDRNEVTAPRGESKKLSPNSQAVPKGGTFFKARKAWVPQFKGRSNAQERI